MSTNEETRNSAAIYGGLVGFFGGEPTAQAPTDYVGSGASLGFGERVEAVQCLLADADGLHLSGRHEDTIAYPVVLRNVSQWDTVMA